MISRDNEVTGCLIDSGRNCDEDEELTLLDRRHLGLEPKWPADLLEPRTASGLHLDLNHSSVEAVDLHRKDVCALETVARESRGPSSPCQLRRNVVFTNRLCLFRVYHASIVLVSVIRDYVLLPPLLNPASPRSAPNRTHGDSSEYGELRSVESQVRVAVLL